MFSTSITLTTGNNSFGMYCCGVVFSIDTREYHRYIFWVACWFYEAVMLQQKTVT